MKSNQIFRVLSATSILLLCLTFGCNPPTPKKEVVEEEQPQSILGQTTQEIYEWDPNGGQEVHEQDEVNLINRTRVGGSYAIHEMARLKVKKTVDLFWASEGRYPKSHEEFMEKVIKFYDCKLPMPTKSCEYHYDVENHELLVVKKKKN